MDRFVTRLYSNRFVSSMVAITDWLYSNAKLLMSAVAVVVCGAYWVSAEANTALTTERLVLVNNRPHLINGLELGDLRKYAEPGPMLRSQRQTSRTIVLLTSDWCGYSRDAQPAWINFIKRLDSKSNLHVTVISTHGSEISMALQRALLTQRIGFDTWFVHDVVGFVAQTGLSSTPRVLVLDEQKSVKLVIDKLNQKGVQLMSGAGVELRSKP